MAGLRLPHGCDSADVQLKTTGLSIGHHPADLAYLLRAKWRSIGHRSPAVTWTESADGQQDFDPSIGGWLKTRLVVDAIQAVLHAQIQLEAFAVASHVEAIAFGAVDTQSKRRVANRREPTSVGG